MVLYQQQVRPESTTTMRVLAKFIGYIISRPFNYDSYRNSTVDNRQIELRNEVSGDAIKALLLVADEMMCININRVSSCAVRGLLNLSSRESNRGKIVLVTIPVPLD
ncbi:hypothetical protein CpipJ_CPIJ016914 [Culex quinquefasciatus]|uniref:Uncharacterized protein n=1 Tax=Culex quinquefasciatus TaxID=7176 RepID=B0XBN9_CULQU|nr:hypothetical protein CpipJ_CPIJ016914 [Culex quinquefasciatus]|eukprot:XP_001867061.1 hypothetical protein CpipJ_CPIJ016914 [Culex quinquefasciatus]